MTVTDVFQETGLNSFSRMAKACMERTEKSAS